jgi:Tfp pilus assembly protein PilF
VLSLAYEFFYRTGDLGAAQKAMENRLALCEPEKDSSSKAIAYGNLGNLYQTRGDLDQAEDMYRKSITTFRELGSPLADEVATLLKELHDIKSEQ